ncbi:hypothetical protein M2161_004315 [Streptomyces sp. SAI-133]|nr:hypothetical protein [Streptomyces sp. SAI-133]
MRGAATDRGSTGPRRSESAIQGQEGAGSVRSGGGPAPRRSPPEQIRLGQVWSVPGDEGETLRHRPDVIQDRALSRWQGGLGRRTKPSRTADPVGARSPAPRDPAAPCPARTVPPPACSPRPDPRRRASLLPTRRDHDRLPRHLLPRPQPAPVGPCPPAHRHRPLATYPPPPALWRPHTATPSIRTPSPSPPEDTLVPATQHRHRPIGATHRHHIRPLPIPRQAAGPATASVRSPSPGRQPARHRIRPLPIPRQGAGPPAPPRQPRRRYPQHMNDPSPEGRLPCPDTVKE